MNEAQTTADLLNFLEQTAQLRLSPKWQDVRQLLATRGHAADRMILFGCDHAGDQDMQVWFALPSGEIVRSIMREDKASGQYASILEWESRESLDDEMTLAQRIVTTPDTARAFAKAVES